MIFSATESSHKNLLTAFGDKGLGEYFLGLDFNNTQGFISPLEIMVIKGQLFDIGFLSELTGFFPGGMTIMSARTIGFLIIGCIINEKISPLGKNDELFEETIGMVGI